MAARRIPKPSSTIWLCCIIAIHRLMSVPEYIIDRSTNISYVRNTLKNLDKRVLMSYCERSGSSEAVAMFLQEMGMYQGLNYTGFVHGFQNKNRKVFSAKYEQVTLSMLMSNDWYKFKVVRNPYSRMVSSYFQIMFYPQASTAFFRLFDKLSLQTNATFEQFCDLTLSLHTMGRMAGIEQHASLQAYQFEIDLYHRNGKTYNQIVHIESFEKDIAVVNRETNMSFHTGLYHDTHNFGHYDPEPGRYYGDIAFDQLIRMHYFAYPSDYRVFYSDQTLKIIKDVYSNDFMLYEYDNT